MELHHTSRKLPSGGEVIILDTGAYLSPESEAMLQALHSRSIGGLRSHLEVLRKRGPENFMANFYVGYGHKSIGDCGTITLFIEGVSMLAAKAIQDSPLYSGQEASTRYIDFSQQPFLLPSGVQEGQEILEKYRAFYLSALKDTIEALKIEHPCGSEENPIIWEKAIKARAFDICRCFLPAGACTNLAWHTNLRQAADKLQQLRHHPLEEVQEIAQALQEALLERYPNSFGHKQYPETEAFVEKYMKHSYLYHGDAIAEPLLHTHAFDTKKLMQFQDLLSARPQKTEMPQFLAECGTLSADFMLDFGSFRDLQRHRAIHQRMPRLTFDLGFHPWHIEALPTHLQQRTKDFLKEQEIATQALHLTADAMQYFIPMGYRIRCHFEGHLAAVTYMLELRSTQFVHPTLQALAQNLGGQLQQFLGSNIPLYISKDFGIFDVKRGNHDIVLR